MDMPNEEFVLMYNRLSKPLAQNNIKPIETEGLPDAIDWTTKGAVTPIKNQGQCGSCWAFSTTGSLETAYFLKNNELKSFSEQQLVDCSKTYGNMGCNGGLMDYAFQYVAKSGITTEDKYAYKGRDGSCQSATSDF
jgi:cathepsin L